MSKKAASKAMLGNQNARKSTPKPDATLSLRCFSEDKEAWTAAAEKENISLNQWVISRLNKNTK
ncbi:MAG TPA: hypothetical protein DCF43_06195 [Pseudomonas sp.]|nr:hypothetical protein [Pseudomonas sp.]